MNEYESLKKAYDRLDELHKKEILKCCDLKVKLRRNVSKRKELEQLVEAHIRLNKDLSSKLKKTEKELATLLKRQQTTKKSTQSNKNK